MAERVKETFPLSESWHLFDVVVAQSAAIFQLPASEDKTLLARRNTLRSTNHQVSQAHVFAAHL